MATSVDEWTQRRPPRFRYLKRFIGVVVSVAALFAVGRVAWDVAITQPIQPAAAADACPPAGAPPDPYPAPSQTTINVYNSTERRGLASTTAELLRARGFLIGKVANAPGGRLLPGPSEVRYGVAGRLESRVLAANVGGRLSFVPDDRTTPTVDLFLGAAFRRIATPREAAGLLPRLPTGC
jgi:LytR cell envelope-related transcriptional attenuator